MRATYVAAAVIAGGIAIVGCSSSGSISASSPITVRTHSIPSPAPAGIPKVTETFTLLPCPPRPTSTLDLEGCAEHRIVALDRRINAVARALDTSLADADSRSDLVDAQTAWIAYRQAACQSESDVYQGGTLAGVVAANCTARINRQRLADLNTMKDELNP